ncbi:MULTISPECIES: DUF3533 domain-containing protein [unclassified Streptomyces]|uniref:DUF3533 domain-containing protein n=1 Tax=unclassified Streptomyces TaxID=2593676 RepID=UPI00093FBC0E|nr:DUF3533 domain-containing protein [Streptomyces sp. TSRI0281]OKI45817.1 hypothetical protein A6A29_29995 [Streptomyces sp. TSRI0281]
MAAQSSDGGLGGHSAIGLRGIRGAGSGRSALLLLGVLVLQTAFVLSCIDAFLEHTPHRIPLAVTAPTTRIADDAFYRLALLPGEPVDPRQVADEAAARKQIRDREVAGALVLAPHGTADLLLVAGGAGPLLAEELAAHVTAAEKLHGRTVRIRDVVPTAPGDPRSLSCFSLVVGWCAGSILCALVLAFRAGGGRAGAHLAPAALGVLLLYSVLAGLLGTLVAGPLMDAAPGNFWALWGLGSLLVLAVGALTLALYELAGVLGIGLALLLVVVLGVPSAGGVCPTELLPTFWRTIGPSLPPGAGLDAARSIAYFSGNGAGGPLRTLSVWAAGGAAVALLCGVLASRAGAPAGQGRRRP